MRFTEYLKLMRIPQWYKNLVILLPLFFVGDLFQIGFLKLIVFGFFGLCFISSANYALNDIVDIAKDMVHPEKKLRPLASGKISILEAVLLIVLLLAVGLYIGYCLNTLFLLCLVFLFLFTVFYSLALKKEVVADVIAIAINFVVRAISGAFIINVNISPWLILCPFFLALFLAVGKRFADFKYMKENAHHHKVVLKYYTPEMTNALMIISTACLIVSYALYSLSRNSLMLITLPFAIYAVFRYYHLITSGSKIARHPEMVYTDWRLLASIMLWVAILGAIFYFVPVDPKIFF